MVADKNTKHVFYDCELMRRARNLGATAPWCRATTLTAGEHSLDELAPAERAVSVLVLATEEVGDAQFLRADPRDVPLPPQVEVEVLEALQLKNADGKSRSELREKCISRLPVVFYGAVIL